MASNLFLISLIAITVLLVAFILFLLFTGRGNVGKQVLKMMKEQKALDEILEYGKKKNWKDREIKLYYLLYTTQDYMKSGYNSDEIESMAEDSGWPKDLIQIVSGKLR